MNAKDNKSETEVKADESVEQTTPIEVEEPEILDKLEQTDALKKELQDTNDKLMRLSADFDNYRKRNQKDKEEWSRYAAQGLIEKLLPILDSLDHATDSISNVSQETQSMVDGFLMIQKQFIEILQQEGLKEIPAMGENFDPNIHNAVMQSPLKEGEQDNQVVLVMRKGYLYRERVIRASMVQVAKDI